VGSTNSADKTKIVCTAGSKDKVKPCGGDFNTGLDRAFPHLAFASAEGTNAQISEEPARRISANAQTSAINQIVTQAGPQLTKLIDVQKVMALEIIDLDKNIALVKKLLDEQLALLMTGALVEQIKEINPESFLSDILLAVDPDKLLPDFEAIFAGIPDLLTPLDELDGLIKSIPDPSDIQGEIGKVSGGITNLKKGVTGGEISFKTPSPLDGLTCKIGVAGSPSCTGKASIKLPGVFSGLTCSVPASGSPSCSGNVVGRVDGVARCTFDVSGSLNCVACSQASVPFACIDKACSCVETCAGDKRTLKNNAPC